MAELSIDQAKAEIKRLSTRASNAEYMYQAAVNMLGEKGLAVVDSWRKKGVLKVHYAWGPDAHKLTGEERAEHILSLEAAKGYFRERKSNPPRTGRTPTNLSINTQNNPERD